MMKKSYFLISMMMLLVFSWFLPSLFFVGSKLGADRTSINITPISFSTNQQGITDFRILFVDDDGGDSWQTDYISIFTALGLDYDTTTSRPNATVMGQYDIVVWHTGDYEGAGETFEYAYDEDNLTVYLQNGGRLLLSSQDWIYNMGLSPFVQNYLGVANAIQDYFGDIDSDCNDTLYGTLGDPIGDGFSPFNTTYPASYAQFGDYLRPVSFANAIFYNNTLTNPINATAIRTENSTYGFKTVFFGVPFEVFNLNRTHLMEKILFWLISDEITPIINPISPSIDEDGTIQFNWTAIPNAIQYYIYKANSLISSPSGIPLTTTTYTNYTDIISTDGEYYYALVANYGWGNSSLSNCVNVTIAIRSPSIPGFEAIVIQFVLLTIGLLYFSRRRFLKSIDTRLISY